MKVLLLLVLACTVIGLLFVVVRRRNLEKEFALTPEAKSRIKPRIISAEAFERLTSRVGGVPVADLFETPLKIVYVVDAPKHVMYLTYPMLDPIGVTNHELHELAVANLRAATAGNVVSAVLENQTAVMLKTMDGFDAARLILLPSMLRDGQELAAVIPDRDTLGLMPIPNDWNSLKNLAESAVGEPLFPRALLVTSKGIYQKP